VTDGAGTKVADFSYDDYGRLKGLSLANGVSRSVSYDSQDRLAGLTYSGVAESLPSCRLAH
jgi:YD repeat-containing protein